MNAVNPLFATFSTDPKLEQEGVWISYGPNSKGHDMEFLLARSGGANDDFNQMLERETKPHRKAIQTGVFSNARTEALYLKTFVATVLKGWRNVEDRNCTPVEYSQANALAYLKSLPNLYEDLKEQANNLAIFREEIREADLGNSGTASSTGGSKASPN